VLFFRVYPNPHPRPLLSANVVYPDRVGANLAAHPLPCRPNVFRPFDIQLSTVNLFSLNPCARRLPRPLAPSKRAKNLGTTPATSLDATLTNHPTSVASKRLTQNLTPLDATLVKFRGVEFPAHSKRINFRRKAGQPFPLPPLFPLSPLLPSSYALFWTTAASYLFCYLILAHSFRANGGCIFPRFSIFQFGNRPQNLLAPLVCYSSSSTSPLAKVSPA
jgi:hypothetical protein